MSLSSAGASAYPVKELMALRDMPIDQLKQIASDPSNPLSTFAIAGILRKQNDAQLQQTAGIGSKPTVANQVLQQVGGPGLPNLQNPALNAPPPQAQPQTQAPQTLAEGGVAGLPVEDDMYNFAGGGIVAFAGKDGSYVLGDDQDWTDEYRQMRDQATQQQLSNKYGLAAQPTFSVNTPYDAALDYYKGLNNQSALTFDKGIPGVTSAISNLTDRKNAWLEGHKDPFTKEAPVGSKANPQNAFAAPSTTQADMSKVMGSATYNPDGSNNLSSSLLGVNNPNPVAAPNANPAAPAKDPFAIAPTRLPGIPKPPGMDVPEALTPELAQKQTAELQNLYGIDPDYFKKKSAANKETLDKEEATNRNLDEASIWMAAAKGIATPGRGRWVGATADAIQTPLKQYADDIKSIHKEQRTAADAAADAEYNLKIGNVKEAQNLIEKRNEAIDKAKNTNALIQSQNYSTQVNSATQLATNALTNSTMLQAKKLELDPERQGEFQQFSAWAKNQPKYQTKDSQGNQAFDLVKALSDYKEIAGKKSLSELYNDYSAKLKIAGQDPMPPSEWLQQMSLFSDGANANTGFKVIRSQG